MTKGLGFFKNRIGKPPMRTILIIQLLILSIFLSSSHGEPSMRIKYKDGRTKTIPVTSITKITFDSIPGSSEQGNAMAFDCHEQLTLLGNGNSAQLIIRNNHQSMDKTIRATIYSIDGKLIAKCEDIGNGSVGGNLKNPTSGLVSSGVYLISVLTEHKRLTKRFSLFN